MRLYVYRALVALLALSVATAGCGWKVIPPKAPPEVGSGSVADRVVLQVNDGAVAWGRGELGQVVSEKLVAFGGFEEVYYPVEPRNPPPMRLVVTASGEVDEEVFLGTMKSMFIGFLLFIPVGIVRFNKDYRLEANVKLIEEARVLQEFRVESATEISHTLFSDIAAYEPEARRVAFENLAEQIMAELRRGSR